MKNIFLFLLCCLKFAFLMIFPEKRKMKYFMFKSSSFMRFCLQGFLTITLLTAKADEKPTIPTRNQISPVYLSTQVLLAPCDDYADQTDTYSRGIITVARKIYPEGICSDNQMKDLLFKARFLQRASIAVADDPISIFRIVHTQDSKLTLCKDKTCLSAWLTDVIGTFELIYLKSDESKPNTGSKWKKTPTISKAMSASLSRQVSAGIDRECGAIGAYKTLVKNNRGVFLFVTCKLEDGSNQVNFPSWVYQLIAGRAKLLLKDDNGPFYEQQQQCNGLPDLRTSARVNMGEHSVAIYRFDGRRYQNYFSYTDESIGDEWSIARYPSMANILITCH